MSTRLDLPIGVENDASCAAYAEHAHGAGRGTSYFGTLTLGTGVGGGIVFDGKLLHAWSELGHMVIVADGVPCQGACAGPGPCRGLLLRHGRDPHRAGGARRRTRPRTT